MLKQLFLNKVNEAYPSIFTKQDVAQLIEEIFAAKDLAETPKPSFGLTFDQRMELEGLIRQAIERRLDRMDNEMIDFDSAEFNIEYGNTLRLEDVDINTDMIVDELEISISQVIGDFFQPIEEEVVNETPYATEQ